MRSLFVTITIVISLVRSSVYASTDFEAELNGILNKASADVLQQLEVKEQALNKRGLKASCNIRNIAIRREFGDLSKKERKAYTDAVQCLTNKPARTPTSLFPGVRSRFDDFVATHLNSTLFIHFSGTFLSWHRSFTWEYEQALRNECGYNGYQPYWDWSKWAAAPQDSPLFDGSAYSLGGNGAPIPHDGLVLPPPLGSGPPTVLPPGLGGGCVQKGPFANLTVNLGPLGLFTGAPGPDGGRGYNPRCLKRDIGPYPSLTYCNYKRIFNLMTQRKTILDFQNDLEGDGTGDLAPHGGGHFTIGGDPGGDFFTSPGDPSFYLHHAQVDRMWTLWQAQDPATRQYALHGTNTFLNLPPSANTTLDDIVDLGYSAQPTYKIRDLMNTVKGPFCYIYL
ncbi:hypothetical protein WAI453_004635 [Rhynchosporium graminicola]|uniref:Related to monophenol monooxygenase (Tyrosinase) n=1 Tax=Rhynchosporium graminicola TaxID=2792576 RepID=A0A1E1LM99_9HELO|nr:related to monophenol monooxygenase (tyrosinase) [Rhynchosporium commune]